MAPTEIYTLSLHDALPISLYVRWAPITDEGMVSVVAVRSLTAVCLEGTTVGPRGIRALGRLPNLRKLWVGGVPLAEEDRKSTRLNSSHANISYAVFCLKKK